MSSIRESIDRSRMTAFQAGVVGMCLVINLFEGFDVLVIAFAASGIAKEWSLTASQVGLLLSSSLVGMALGSALIAPLSDRIGRRPHTLICLAVCAVGMLLATVSTGFWFLGVCRLLTGLGAGGMVAGLPVIITEYSPRRFRGMMIALYGTGLPVGGMLGGSVAVLVTSAYGWRAGFLVGAVLTFAILVVVALALPESLDYLISRRPEGALEKVNKLLGRMRLPAVEALPPVPPKEERGVLANVLHGREAVRTVALWVAYFFMMASFYFAESWTPLLLQHNGSSTAQGMDGGLLLNLGGLAGTLLLSVLALKVATRTLTVLAFLGAGLSYLAMSLFLGSTVVALAAAVAIGLFVNASGNALNSIVPGLYPASVRATGVGWAMAVGRLGAFSAPALAGLLLDHGWSARSLFGLLVLPLVLVAALIAVIVSSGRRSRTSTEPAGSLSPVN